MQLQLQDPLMRSLIDDLSLIKIINQHNICTNLFSNINHVVIVIAQYQTFPLKHHTIVTINAYLGLAYQ